MSASLIMGRHFSISAFRKEPSAPEVRCSGGGIFCPATFLPPVLNHPAKKSTTPVSRLYIAPAILMAPFDSISARTGLSL